MSDPIEKLSRLGDALEGAPMPLTASEIRARGDRIRRRNHALIAGLSVAVVAAVAVPIIALTTSGSDDGDRIAPKPTVSDPNQVVDALGERNLLTGEDAIYPNGGPVDWIPSQTYEGSGAADWMVAGDGPGSFSPCSRGTLEDLGAASALGRDFNFVDTATGDLDLTLVLKEVVAEFGSSAEAEEAYATIVGWLDDCMPQRAETYSPGEWTPVDVPVGEAQQMVATYGPVDESIDPYGDEGWILDTGIVLAGDRIAVLTQLTHGYDYNWLPEDGGTPVQRMLPSAAHQLVNGGPGAATTVTATPDPIGSPTELPEDFPLTSGWPEDDGSSEYRLDPPSSDNQAMLAAGELQGCQSIDDGDPTSRLTARIDWGSSAYRREIQLFADPDQARAFLDSVQDSYSACADQEPTDAVQSDYQVSQGAVGDESWVITAASDGIGRTVINVVRVGSAVLVDLTSDEGTGDTVEDLATETRENLADVVNGMYELQGG